MIRLEGVEKSFATASRVLPVLKGIDLEVAGGEFVAVTGPSGSGKSTLLAILGILDRPTGGRYFFAGADVAGLSDTQEAALRNREIGFVFQAFNLIQTLTVAENVEIPLFYAGVPRAERRRLAADSLGRVGLGERLSHRPAELSGGEQQRAAIARALVRRPSVLLADEPTGNLDSQTSEDIMSILEELHADGNTVVVITHDPLVANHTRRRISLIDGAIEADVRVEADSVLPQRTQSP